MLPAEVIGVKLPSAGDSKWQVPIQVHEEDLMQLKALTRLDHSSVVS